MGVKSQMDTTVMIVIGVVLLVLFLLFLSGVRTGGGNMLDKMNNVFGNLT